MKIAGRVKKRKKSEVHFPEPTSEPLFKAGDHVVLWSDSRNKYCRKEYGRVICSVWNKFIGAWDVYTAFFGFSWPKKDVDYEKFDKPYVLRYFETSLRRLIPTTRSRGTSESAAKELFR